MALKDSLCVFVILTAWGQVIQVIRVMIAIIAIIVIVVIIEEVVILVMILHLFNALCKQLSHAEKAVQSIVHALCCSKL